MSASPGSDSSQPNRKRPRTDSSVSANQSQQEETFRRDEQLSWYEDGNIIIVAQGIGFRLSKGLLAQNSQVFRDMLSLPQPSDASHVETYDGCPVVHVTDTVDELRVLAMTVFNGFSFVRNSGLSFDDVAMGIRVAHKYNIQGLLDRSLRILDQYYPSSYTSWDEAVTCLEDDWDPTRAITGVKLARLTGSMNMLPAALYMCCQLDGRVLLEGRNRPDGSVDTLSPEDLALCINGKTKLCTYFSEVLFQIFAPITGPRSKPCLASKGRCARSIGHIQAAFFSFSDEPSGQGQCDILRSWCDAIKDLTGTRNEVLDEPLCRACIDSLCARAETLREESWLVLPALFGVGRNWRT
ncbi:uncharacterized protein B0H18DRAFT_877402 [Fomitopsis serialis]|uniref:uncharacterized protein n=1 Tax=Fomitopsis serialis TaxID=139415 RepID=UPI002007E9D3|nr:uncharacterized protein B0H18DRAFT_877402 [Neoantrodia serialis]KAH9925125.1 hypothetical protein B0H18DRAFT_877402 [Neoantrodia serialis]